MRETRFRLHNDRFFAVELTRAEWALARAMDRGGSTSLAIAHLMRKPVSHIAMACRSRTFMEYQELQGCQKKFEKASGIVFTKGVFHAL